MDIDEYIQSGETVYCRTSTTKFQRQDSTDGELACTGSRLIFIGGSEVSDFDLASIEEIRYDPEPIPWDYIVAAVLLFLGGIGSWFVMPAIEFLPEVLRLVTLLFAVVLAAALLIDAYNRYEETLHIRLSQRTHHFRGGELEDFPHAIRGAA